MCYSNQNKAILPTLNHNTEIVAKSFKSSPYFRPPNKVALGNRALFPPLSYMTANFGEHHSASERPICCFAEHQHTWQPPPGVHLAGVKKHLEKYAGAVLHQKQQLVATESRYLGARAQGVVPGGTRCGDASKITN